MTCCWSSFFLRVLSDRDKRYRPPSSKDLVINGAYSDVTGAYIKQFADQNNQTPIYDEGRLAQRGLTQVESPVGKPSGSGGWGAWINMKMNEDFQRWFPKTGLAQSALFPNELRKKFYV